MLRNLVSPLSNGNQTVEHAMEISIISSYKEIQDTFFSRQVDVDHLGFSNIQLSVQIYHQLILTLLDHRKEL
jgi:hypothetical protein